jgi:hypothetical protein
MKNNITKAQMGGSYAGRRAYKGAGSTPSKKEEPSSNKKSPGFGKDMDSKRMSNAKVVDSLQKRKTAEENKAKLARDEESRKSYEETQRKYDAAQKAKKKVSTKPTSSKPAVNRTSETAISAPKREMPSMSAPKPSVSGISKGPEKRSYSKTESKMVAELQKMKSGKNTEMSQMRLKALQDKRRAEKIRAEKKSKRIEKRAAVKAVKKSYK